MHAEFEVIVFIVLECVCLFTIEYQLNHEYPLALHINIDSSVLQLVVSCRRETVQSHVGEEAVLDSPPMRVQVYVRD